MHIKLHVLEPRENVGNIYRTLSATGRSLQEETCVNITSSFETSLHGGRAQTLRSSRLPRLDLFIRDS